jgi:glyoxylase-like metal-dependent hydrolase (beta-lactamase superfamily II)
VEGTHLRKATTLLSGVFLLVVASGQACAETPGPDSSTILITLGTAGGPVPREDRMQSSNLLVVNGTLYLIDAGGGVTHRLVEAGYDYRQAGKIFITHAHSDHIAGLVTSSGRAGLAEIFQIEINNEGVPTGRLCDPRRLTA